MVGLDVVDHDVVDLVERDDLDDALTELQRFGLLHPESERALLQQQEIHWRKNNIPDYAAATQDLERADEMVGKPLCNLGTEGFVGIIKT